jgi:hypothetical protein
LRRKVHSLAFDSPSIKRTSAAFSHSFGGVSPVLTGRLITALREIIR